MQAGSFDAMLNNSDATLAALHAGCECLQVLRQRGVDLSRYAETRPFLTNSALRRQIYIWMMRRMFRPDEYAKRCSARALGDPVEVKTFYDDLITAGRSLGVSMAAIESYRASIFEVQKSSRIEFR